MLDGVRKKLSEGRFNFSRHALKRVVERNISEVEISEADENAKVIEDYPDDKYTPSCLLFGLTQSDRPLHIQVSLTDTDLVKIITLYEPSEDEWIDNSIRR